MDNVSLWHIIQACINMELARTTTVLVVRYSAPFWCEELAPLNLIFCCSFNSSSINFEVFNIPLSLWYTFIITPWLLYYLSKVSFSLTVSVAFISTWCLMLLWPLAWSIKTPSVQAENDTYWALTPSYYSSWYHHRPYNSNISTIHDCTTFHLKVILVTYQENLILLESHPSSSIYPHLFSGQYYERHRDPS